MSNILDYGQLLGNFETQSATSEAMLQAAQERGLEKVQQGTELIEGALPVGIEAGRLLGGIHQLGKDLYPKASDLYTRMTGGSLDDDLGDAVGGDEGPVGVIGRIGRWLRGSFEPSLGAEGAEAPSGILDGLADAAATVRRGASSAVSEARGALDDGISSARGALDNARSAVGDVADEARARVGGAIDDAGDALDNAVARANVTGSDALARANAFAADQGNEALRQAIWGPGFEGPNPAVDTQNPEYLALQRFYNEPQPDFTLGGSMTESDALGIRDPEAVEAVSNFLDDPTQVGQLSRFSSGIADALQGQKSAIADAARGAGLGRAGPSDAFFGGQINQSAAPGIQSRQQALLDQMASERGNGFFDQPEEGIGSATGTNVNDLSDLNDASIMSAKSDVSAALGERYGGTDLDTVGAGASDAADSLAAAGDSVAGAATDAAGAATSAVTEGIGAATGAATEAAGGVAEGVADAVAGATAEIPGLDVATGLAALGTSLYFGLKDIFGGESEAAPPPPTNQFGGQAVVAAQFQ